MTVFRRLSISIIVLALIVGACSSTADEPTSTTSSRETSTTRRSPTTTIGRSTTTSTPTSTTSTPTTTPQSAPQSTTPSQAGDGPIGVVGCSNTDQSVTGYRDASSLDRLIDGDLGGGTASIWGDPSNSSYSQYWSFYDNRRPAGGLSEAWVQICLRTKDHGGVFDQPEMDWISHIVTQLQLRDPGIKVWISPLNFYDGVVCDAVGPDGPAIAAETANWAAANLSGAFRGPDLGPLTANQIARRDNCHLNESGRSLVGSQLVAFFD
jgi:hypothetical protein